MMAALPVPIDDTGRTEEEVDHEKIQHVLYHLIKIFGDAGSADPTTVTNGAFYAHPVIQALNYEECELFTELLALGQDAIKELRVPPYRIAPPPGAPRGSIGILHPAVPLHGKWIGGSLLSP